MRKGLDESEGAGTGFMTAPEHTQQVARISYFDGAIIANHKHKRVKRTIDTTPETLIIIKGALIYSIFDDQNQLTSTGIAVEDDILTLLAGGHGFKTKGDTVVYEIKQGGYVANDKSYFISGVSDGIVSDFGE